MRIILTASIAVLAAVTINVTSSKAQFFNERFCTFGGGFNSSGAPDCAFHTWEQCVASARGLGRYCGENPRYQWDRAARGSQRRVRRERDN
jgi:hypothetical protein